MTFNSLHFVVFFPVVFLGYHLLADRLRWIWLLLASLYFYMAWRAEYVVLLLAVIAIAFYLGIRIEDAKDDKEKRRAVALGLTVLFFNLFIFKYFNFFNDQIRAVFEAAGVNYGLGSLDLILPIGISFYTFQKGSYLVDIYRGKIKAERHFGIFALYASFFPQLVAGPIERGPNLLPQFREEHRFDYEQVSSGLRLMAWGLFKKTVVADRLAPFVNDVYGSPTTHEGPALILATLFFTFQVYCDFSGYTDIAIGAARTLGFRLMTNFRQPYFASSISDFWKRWHISLSTWLTDYVYTPLTRARWMKLHWYTKLLVSLMLTFLVSGIWHGANWTYIAWGAIHGAYLVSSVLTTKLRARVAKALALERFPRFHSTFNVMLTFMFVCISYIFFRASSISDACYILWNSVLAAPRFVLDLALVRPAVFAEFADDRGIEFGLSVLGILVVMGRDLVALGKFGFLGKGWELPVVRRAADFAVTASVVILGAFYSGQQSFIYFEF